MFHDRVFDFDGGDVLAAGDDDVLLAVAEFDVAVGMDDADVAGVEPAAAEGLLGGFGIGVVAGHHVVAAHHHLAHRGGVGGHVVHRLVDDAHVRRVVGRNALARHHARLGLDVEVLPLALHRAGEMRAVGLGEAVEMRHRARPSSPCAR